MMAGLRGLIFYLGYILFTVVWGAMSVLIAWLLPYRWRFRLVILAWTSTVLAWLRLTCGIHYRVEGRENIPETPCIVFAKHESTWETMMVQQLFHPQATLIKKQLLLIPFFGWAFRLLRPIAIDRRDSRRALQTLIHEGSERLASGIWVLLFPEGTRVAPGTMGKFQVGGAALAEATASPILVVAHNSGRFWPAHTLAKHPGTITVKISPPIATQGKKRKEINRLANDWMSEAVAELNLDQTSRLTTDKAFNSMNSRLGST
jgi:1-acyl-sn-glycerol-3-phosphate acyltransferase